MRKNWFFVSTIFLMFIAAVLMQSCIKPISAELPPLPPTFKAKVNSKAWTANGTVTAAIQHDPVSGCAFLTLSGIYTPDPSNPTNSEQMSITMNNLNAFTGTDLCPIAGTYFEMNNAGNPATGCTAGGANGRIYTMALYGLGTATVVSNGSNMCTLKITSCKNNSISGTFSFKAVDNSVTPAKTYNITGGTFTDVPIVKIN